MALPTLSPDGSRGIRIGNLQIYSCSTLPLAWKMKNFWKTPKSISALDCMPAFLFMNVSSIGRSARKIVSTKPGGQRT